MMTSHRLGQAYLWLNHPSHRKCITIADVQVDCFATKLAQHCMELRNSRI